MVHESRAIALHIRDLMVTLKYIAFIRSMDVNHFTQFHLYSVRAPMSQRNSQLTLWLIIDNDNYDDDDDDDDDDENNKNNDNDNGGNNSNNDNDYNGNNNNIVIEEQEQQQQQW